MLSGVWICGVVTRNDCLGHLHLLGRRSCTRPVGCVYWSRASSVSETCPRPHSKIQPGRSSYRGLGARKMVGRRIQALEPVGCSTFIYFGDTCAYAEYWNHDNTRRGSNLIILKPRYLSAARVLISPRHPDSQDWVKVNGCRFVRERLLFITRVSRVRTLKKCWLISRNHMTAANAAHSSRQNRRWLRPGCITVMQSNAYRR